MRPLSILVLTFVQLKEKRLRQNCHHGPLVGVAVFGLVPSVVNFALERQE